MTKRMWSGLFFAASLATSGCRMCCPSYDYCGPTEPGVSNSESCGMERRGSILGGMPRYVEGATYTEGETIIETPQNDVPLMAPPEAPQIPQPPKFDNRAARRVR